MTWEGASAARAALDAIRARVIAVAPDVVRDGALLLQAQQRDNASHRPGPDVITGNLRRGILTDPVHQTGPSSWSGGTRTTVIYSRIQERGGMIEARKLPRPSFRYAGQIGAGRGRLFTLVQGPPMLVWTDGPRPVTPEGWRAAEAVGRVHRARRVRIPARPYFAPAIPQTAPKYEALANKRFAAAILGN